MLNRDSQVMERLEEWVEHEETIIAWHRLRQRVHSMRGSVKTGLLEDVIDGRIWHLRQKQDALFTKLFTEYNWE